MTRVLLHFLIDVLFKLFILMVCVNLLFHFFHGRGLTWQGLVEWEGLPDRLLFVGRVLLMWLQGALEWGRALGTHG